MYGILSLSSKKLDGRVLRIIFECNSCSFQFLGLAFTLAAILGELLNFDKKIFTLCFVIKFSIVFKKSDQIFQLCMNF